jgi:hypothetical protein
MSLCNASFIRLFDPAGIPPDRLFHRFDGAESGYSVATFAMSRYEQLDLEMWHVERGLKDAGDRAGAQQMHEYRSALFDITGKYLADHAPQDHRTADNPLGFTTSYEKIQYEHSPLRYPTFKKFLSKHGDDDMWIWHGDSIGSRFVGIHGTNTPLTKAARGVAKQRGERGGTNDFIAELHRVEGSSDATGYQSFTSDLGLLAEKNGFADRRTDVKMDLSAMKPWQRSLVERVVPVGKTVQARSDAEVVLALLGRSPRSVPEGHLDITGLAPDNVNDRDVRGQIAKISPDHSGEVQQRIQKALEGGGSPQRRAAATLLGIGADDRALVDLHDLMTPEQIGELRPAIDKVRSLITLERNPAKPTELAIHLHTRAYGVRVSKADALPGIEAIGAEGFEFEQEVHVLDHVWPNRIEVSLLRGDLAKPLKGAAPAGSTGPAGPAGP